MNRSCLIGAHSSRNTRVRPSTSPAPWHQITFLSALLIHVAFGTFPRLDRSVEVRRKREEKRKMEQFHTAKKKTQRGGGARRKCDPFSNVPAAATWSGDVFSNRRRRYRGINHVQAAFGCTQASVINLLFQPNDLQAVMRLAYTIEKNLSYTSKEICRAVCGFYSFFGGGNLGIVVVADDECNRFNVAKQIH